MAFSPKDEPENLLQKAVSQFFVMSGSASGDGVVDAEGRSAPSSWEMDSPPESEEPEALDPPEMSESPGDGSIPDFALDEHETITRGDVGVKLEDSGISLESSEYEFDEVPGPHVENYGLDESGISGRMQEDLSGSLDEVSGFVQQDGDWSHDLVKSEVLGWLPHVDLNRDESGEDTGGEVAETGLDDPPESHDQEQISLATHHPYRAARTGLSDVAGIGRRMHDNLSAELDADSGQDPGANDQRQMDRDSQADPGDDQAIVDEVSRDIGTRMADNLLDEIEGYDVDDESDNSDQDHRKEPRMSRGDAARNIARQYPHVLGNQRVLQQMPDDPMAADRKRGEMMGQGEMGGAVQGFRDSQVEFISSLVSTMEALGESYIDASSRLDAIERLLARSL